MARQRGPLALAEEPEAVIQPRRDTIHPERGHPAGGELDRQGNPVDPSADLRGDGRQRLGQHELGRHSLHAVDEQLNGGERHRPFDGQPLAVLGVAQGLQPHDGLGADPQRLAAGGDDLHARRLAEDVLGDRRGGVGHVLAIVQDQQLAALREVANDVAEGVGYGLLRAEGRGDARRDQRRVSDRAEIDEAHPVFHLRAVRGAGDRNRRLADPAGADDRHQTVDREEPGDQPDLPLAADHGVEQGRQTASRHALGARPRALGLDACAGPGLDDHRCGERIAAADDVDDIVAAVRRRPQKLAQGADRHPQINVLDPFAAPHPLGQLGLGDHVPYRLDQGQQEVERLVPDVDGRAVPLEHAAHREQQVRSERDPFGDGLIDGFHTNLRRSSKPGAPRRGQGHWPPQTAHPQNRARSGVRRVSDASTRARPARRR